MKCKSREGRSYICLPYYKKLQQSDDYTIFLQGDPFDHTPNLNKILSKLLNNNIDFLYKNLSSKIWGCQLTKDQLKDLKIKQVYSDLYNLKNPKNFLFKFGVGLSFVFQRN